MEIMTKLRTRASAVICALVVLVSCSHQNHASIQKNDEVLINFGLERSYDPYLNRDSVLQTIPDTLGFILDNVGDTTDLKLQEASLREHREWLKFYKTPR